MLTQAGQVYHIRMYVQTFTPATIERHLAATKHYQRLASGEELETDHPLDIHALKEHPGATQSWARSPAYGARSHGPYPV